MRSANSIKMGMTRLNLSDLGFEWISALDKELKLFNIFTEVSLSNDADEDDVVVAVLSTSLGPEKIEMRWRVAEDKVFRVVEYTHDGPRRVYYKLGALEGWVDDHGRLDKELLTQADKAFYFTPEGYIAPIKYRERLETFYFTPEDYDASIKYRERLEDVVEFARRRDEIQPLPKDKSARELAIRGRELAS